MKYRHFPAAVLAAGLLFCTLFSGLTAYADDKKSELTQKQTETRQEYETAQSALEELQNEQTQTESEVAALTGQAAELAGQITAVTAAVQNAQTVLDERQAAADAARAALDAKQAEYDARLAVCREQLRAMQRLDGGGAVWLLAQAKSLYQLLTFDAVLQQMSARNSTVLAELDAEAAALEQARAAADEAARQAADAKAALEQQQAALADTQTALEAALLDANSTLTAQQAAAQAQAAVTDAAKKAYEDATAALDAYVREQSRRYTTADLHLTSLDFRCPLDSYGRITTQFAEPDPWGIPHRGTDFAAPGGTPIYAIADGVVSAARTMNSYGNCVQVSHGTADDGHRYDSLYAHMSSIAVAQGAAVQKGDLLGYVGNTGNVYGAGGGYHLHLELRVDGSRADPLGFVPTHKMPRRGRACPAPTGKLKGTCIALTFGDFLYYTGFHVEYTAVRVGRGLAALAHGAARALLTLLAVVLRPAVRAADSFKAALTHPRQLAGYAVPLLAVGVLAWFVRTALARPFVLRVEVGGQVVGYVTDEQAFDAARADVQARLTGVAGWNVQPAYTLVMADADTRPMTERETADAILRAAGGEITEGTAVYLDGALRFVTDEGDHLRQFLYAVRAPWQTDGVQTDFAHALRLVDGIYPAAAITPYRDLTAALQADDLLQVKAVRYETVTRELPFETQTIEDAGLDFGKTETVQAGQNGSELVTSEITTVAGEVVSTRVVDVQLVQASVPEVIHRGTRLKSGMIGRLGTGSFLWPVPGYSGISRWASLPYGHRGVDITAPYGTPIYAADAGTVIAAQWHNHPTMSWGYYVEIDHGNGYKTLYAHMSSFVVQAGQTVEKGQLIGYVGATGAATGPHCHFEMYYNNALISARNVFPDM